MKKITFLLMLLTVTFGFSQAPTVDPATPPARDAADVVSIFSEAYSNITGADYNPDWGQSGFGTASSTYDTGSGNLVLAYPNFSYQGIALNANYDVSTMEYLHVDIWTDGGVAPNIFLISPGPVETPYAISNVAGSWQSLDIPLSNFSPVDLVNVFQFKFDGGNGTSSAIYVDNLYFWKNPTAPGSDATLSDLQIDGSTISGFGSGVLNYTVELPNGTTTVPQITSATPTDTNATSVTIVQATTLPGDATVTVVSQNGSVTQTYTVSFVVVGPSSPAPTPPARPAADVVSVYSDAYASTINYVSFDAGWCGGAAVTPVTISGDNTLKKNSGIVCHGIDFSGDKQDLSAFTHIHFDFYTDDTDLTGDVFNVKLVDFGGGTSEASALEVNINGGTTPGIVANQWVSVDVDITSLGGVVANNLTRSDVAQIGITTANLTNVWYDNIYLHKNTLLSTSEFDVVDFKVYPNPTTNNWNINSKQDISTVQLFDVLGKEVLTLTPNSKNVTINSESLNTGLYFAKINSINGTKTIKLVKE